MYANVNILLLTSNTIFSFQKLLSNFKSRYNKDIIMTKWMKTENYVKKSKCKFGSSEYHFFENILNTSLQNLSLSKRFPNLFDGDGSTSKFQFHIKIQSLHSNRKCCYFVYTSYVLFFIFIPSVISKNFTGPGRAQAKQESNSCFVIHSQSIIN